MALSSIQREHEQLRLAAVPVVEPPRTLGFEQKRFSKKGRRKWLLEVGEETHAHRMYYAARHGARAWYELQPRHEPLPSRKLAKTLPALQIRYCDCSANKVVVDIFGADEPQHWQPFHGMKQCTLTDCGGILRPTSDHGWFEYAQALLERVGQSWCTCGVWAIRQTKRHMPWCGECRHPIAPHPIAESAEQCTAVYQAVVEAFYSGAVMRLLRQLEKQRAAAHAHWEETGYEPGDSRERQIEKLEELAAATGLEARHSIVKRPQKPGDPTAPNGSVSGHRWHQQRKKGQIEKLDRVLQCGADQVKHRCTGCGMPGPTVPLRCDNHRLCLGCRDHRNARFRRRFADAQALRIKRLWADNLRLAKTHYVATPDGGKRMRYGGAWGEKFLTLTIPHVGNARQNTKEIKKAWPRFWRLLRAHVEKDLLRGESKATREYLMATHFTYCSVLEVTPGEDWKGHPHLHLWFVAPFIHHDMIRHLWGQAMSKAYQNNLVAVGAVATVDEVIEKLPKSRAWDAPQLRSYLRTKRGWQGKELALVWRSVVHVNEVASGEIASELCKYLVKDGERNKKGELELIDPKAFAMIYAALEGMRTIVTARGLLERPVPSCYCGHCGCVYKRWIEAAPRGPEQRGPPSNQLELELGESEAT